MDGLGENVAKQLVVRVKRVNSSLKTELRKRGGLSSTLVEKMDEMGILGNMPEDNQLSLFEFLNWMFGNFGVELKKKENTKQRSC